MKKPLNQKRVLFTRRIISILSLSFLSLGLLACSTLSIPKPQTPEDTLLVICVDKDLSGGNDYFSYLELKIPSVEKPIKIRAQSFSLIPGLKPGTYKPESLLEFYDPPWAWGSTGSNPPPRPKTISVQFEMKPGFITIFPLKFVYHVSYSNGRSQSGWAMFPISQADKDRLVKELSKSEYFPLWKMD